MKISIKKYGCLMFIFCLSLGLNGQNLFFDNFESGSLATSGWTVESQATDGGWRVGSTFNLSSQYFGIQENGSGFIAGTNDDQCNCNKANERLISPAIDLSGVSSAVVSFDSYFSDGSYQGLTEEALVQISTDKVNWVTLEDLHGHGSWDVHKNDISEYAGESEVYISFLYSDNGGWMFGFGIDNVSVDVPKMLDIELAEFGEFYFAEAGNALPFTGTLRNTGAEDIESVTVNLMIDGDLFSEETLMTSNFSALEFYSFQLSDMWTPTSQGDYLIEFSIVAVNGEDFSSANLSRSYVIEVYERSERPNIIMDILNSVPEVSTIASAADQLDGPMDLDFFPVYGKDELWIVNYRNESSGGSTLTINDASSNPNNYNLRVDGNAWHFMSLPTGIAFSDDNFNFATSPGVQDANHNGGSFTGPTLWSSDPEIYAQPSGGNGSHLDMLHGSPFSLGIAHEVDNVFWVYDDFNKDIVRYDFVEDHGPGNADHSDAIVRRYKNIGINGVNNSIPNHMILDKESGWLYFADNGNNRVMRLNINSGTSTQTIPLINEPLAEHSEVTGFRVETILDDKDMPCGVELLDNMLLIGDYESGEIAVYDINDDFTKVGSIDTGDRGLTGIKVGPDGSIWYTNSLLNVVNKIQAGMTTSVEETLKKADVKMYPMPVSDVLNIDLPSDLPKGNHQISVYSQDGRMVFRSIENSNNIKLNLNSLSQGNYYIRINSEGIQYSSKISLVR